MLILSVDDDLDDGDVKPPATSNGKNLWLNLLLTYSNLWAYDTITSPNHQTTWSVPNFK